MISKSSWSHLHQYTPYSATPPSSAERFRCPESYLQRLTKSPSSRLLPLLNFRCSILSRLALGLTHPCHARRRGPEHLVTSELPLVAVRHVQHSHRQAKLFPFGPESCSRVFPEGWSEIDGEFCSNFNFCFASCYGIV